MKKRLEVEQAIKEIIRDNLALDPLMTVKGVQTTLWNNDYRTAQGAPLDWHYISKLLRKVQIENLARLKITDRTKRLIELKELYRVVLEEFKKIVFYDPTVNPRRASVREQLAAGNSILKYAAAIHFIEESHSILGSGTPQDIQKVVETVEHWNVRRQLGDNPPEAECGQKNSLKLQRIRQSVSKEGNNDQN